jgi:hypothetical protein
VSRETVAALSLEDEMPAALDLYPQDQKGDTVLPGVSAFYRSSSKHYAFGIKALSARFNRNSSKAPLDFPGKGK